MLVQRSFISSLREMSMKILRVARAKTKIPSNQQRKRSSKSRRQLDCYFHFSRGHTHLKSNHR